VIWADAEPKSTLIVTGSPAVQKDPDVVVRPPLRTNDVSLPGASVAAEEAVNVSGSSAPPTAQLTAPPEVMLQGAVHAGCAVPEFVPAKTTSHVVEVHAIGDPPLFLTVIEMATGELDCDPPAVSEAPTTVMLELDAALLTRL
jgi:hypothetical protein